MSLLVSASTNIKMVSNAHEHFEAAAQAFKQLVGPGQTEILIIDLAFKCDNKDLYDPVSCSYNKSIGLLKTSCPDPDDEDELH